MERTVSISVKGLLLAAVALLALLAAYLLGGVGGGGGIARDAQAATTPAATADSPRTIRMVAAGTATAVPDQLAFTVTATSKQADLDAAMTASSRTMTRVLAQLASYGVAKGDVQTTGLSMYPEYDYPSSGPAVLTGYRVTQRAQVLITDLAQGGPAISAAVRTGGDGVRVGNLRLRVGDPDKVLDRARAAAVEEASAKAEQYADATGQSLGEVLSIKEVSAPTTYSSPALYGRVAADSATIPIKAGKDDYKVRVQIVWQLG